MSSLFNLSVAVALLAAALIMVEKHFPQLSEQLDESQLSPQLREWRKAGKMVQVNGYEMFVRDEGGLCDFCHYVDDHVLNFN